MNFENVRFISSILSIVSQGTIINLIASLFRNYRIPPCVAGLLLFATYFLASWFRLYGSWISRARRAVFNERNVMMTYQPRALTHGHLFCPEPPTPVPNASDADSSSSTLSATSAFAKARDEHYKNEFMIAEQMEKERNLAKKEQNPPTTLDNSKKPPETLRIEFSDDEATSSSDTRSPSNSDTKIYRI
ncbi:unnamed protein product [Caenorhabditis angaria]|uniref:Uncharacterized protein n=1 Tax=Caenorhabditis angaria TaxID=860376 RepID=A0A9P1MY23_9PELO|nr:unnamed protein product [Caenorhabditis angaria]